MLLGQHLGGGHESALETIQCRCHKSQKSDDCLSGSYVSLDQAGHRKIFLHIRKDLIPDSLLGPCELIRQFADKGVYLWLWRDMESLRARLSPPSAAAGNR